jgi:aminoglycoside phosphotransferase (APT) family kinase protein
MPPSDVEHLGSEVVPGRGVLDIQFLGTGLYNNTYRAVRDGAAYALRVAGAHSLKYPFDLKPDVAWEAAVLRAAGRSGIAPQLVYADPGRGVLVTRWVEGRSWSPEEVRLPENLRKMAALLRSVHALPIPQPARLMAPADWVNLYGAALSRAGGTIDQELRRRAAARLAWLAELPGAAGVVCHSDLHALNLILAGESSVLIDWEYAHVSDPLWDLAGWSANNDCGAGNQRDLLADYLGSAPSSSTWARFRLLAWLYDYIALLWSELCSRRCDALDGNSPRAAQLDARLRLPAHYAME